MINLEVMISAFLGSFLAALGLMVPVSYWLKKKAESFNPFGGFYDKGEN